MQNKISFFKVTGKFGVIWIILSILSAISIYLLPVCGFGYSPICIPLSIFGLYFLVLFSYSTIPAIIFAVIFYYLFLCIGRAFIYRENIKKAIVILAIIISLFILQSAFANIESRRNIQIVPPVPI